MSDKITKIVEALEGLSIVDALNLVKHCEEKWGVSAAAPVAMAANDAGSEKKEEKTEFEVLLVGAGDKKIDVMKLVRTITQKDLSSAKEFVEKASEANPSSLGSFPKEQADKLAADLKAVGALAQVK
jgi:large subunit ribosomal protein L7/L12